jgi:hypothetical protein
MLAIAVLLAGALPAGCGYASKGLFRSDIRTVYVEFFDNRTFRRGLEVGLTKAIVDEIKLRTPLTLASRDAADSVLGGELVQFEERTRVKDEDDAVLTETVTTTVRFHWRDSLTGAEIVPAQEVSDQTLVASGDPLHDLALRNIAQRVVERMEEDW